MRSRSSRLMLVAIALYFAALVAAIVAVGSTLSPPSVRSLDRTL